MSGVLTAAILLFSGAARLSVLEDGGGYGSEAHKASGKGHGTSAAIGEFENIYLRIENGGEARHLVALEVQWQDSAALLHRVYRPAADGDFFPGARPVADALVPLEEITIPPDGSLDLILVVEVPEFGAPGRYRGTARARFDEGRDAACALEFRVYDVAIPRVRTLPAFFDLDLESVARAVAIPFEDLDSWAAFYDSLNELGIAYRIWFDPAANGAAVDTGLLRDHLAYVAATTPIPVVDVGGAPGHFISREELPSPYDPQDKVQLHLHDMLGSALSVNPRVLPVAQPAAFGPRSLWHRIRQDYARFGRADPRILRILASPPHPHFERYTDIWALPETTPMEFAHAVATGRSLVRYDQSALSHCVGTAGDLDRTGTYQTLASEAVDGSEATEWRPLDPGGGESPWLEITFAELYPLESITLLGNCAPAETGLVVETAYQPGEFTRATLSWDRGKLAGESGLPMYVGKFRHPRACRAVRLRVSSPAAPGAIAIAEVLFNNSELRNENVPIKRIVPWLDYSAPDHPAWLLGGEGYSGAPRALPWRSWALGCPGILGPALNAATPNATPLIAVGQNQLLPTRRLFALRDGLEDYEYLRQYAERVARRELTPPKDFSPGTSRETLAFSAAGDRARRLARDTMGRLLSGESTVTKNFGP